MTTEELEQAVAEQLAVWAAELDDADDIQVRACISASAAQLAKRIGWPAAAQEIHDLAFAMNPEARQ